MKVSVRGFLQGVCNSATAQATAVKFPATIITATCVACGESQKIKKLSTKCTHCGTINWK